MAVTNPLLPRGRNRRVKRSLLKPWYRSLLFWLGAFVAVSFLWLWWDSHRHAAGPVWSRPGQAVYLASMNGEISLMHVRSGSFGRSFEFAHGESDGGSIDESFGEDCDRWSFGPFRSAAWENEGRPLIPIGGFKGWVVSWWFVFCVYLLAWVSVLAWWRRRLRCRAADLMKGGAV